MNNQETEAIKYTGTWYTIKVMDSNSAESVVELIDAIPTITYAGYKTQAEAVKLARDAYDALNAEAKTKVTNLNKLTSAEEAIQFYTEIDARQGSAVQDPLCKQTDHCGQGDGAGRPECLRCAG